MKGWVGPIGQKQMKSYWKPTCTEQEPLPCKPSLLALSPPLPGCTPVTWNNSILYTLPINLKKCSDKYLFLWKWTIPAVSGAKWISPEWTCEPGLKGHTRNCQRLGISIWLHSVKGRKYNHLNTKTGKFPSTVYIAVIFSTLSKSLLKSFDH